MKWLYIIQEYFKTEYNQFVFISLNLYLIYLEHYMNPYMNEYSYKDFYMVPFRRPHFFQGWVKKHAQNIISHPQYEYS